MRSSEGFKKTFISMFTMWFRVFVPTTAVCLWRIIEKKNHKFHNTVSYFTFFWYSSSNSLRSLSSWAWTLAAIISASSSECTFSKALFIRSSPIVWNQQTSKYFQLSEKQHTQSQEADFTSSNITWP